MRSYHWPRQQWLEQSLVGLWDPGAFVVVQSLSCVWLFVTPWTAACQASLSFTIPWSLLKLMSIESVMPSPSLLSPSSPAFNLSQHQGLFHWLTSLHQVQGIGATASASVLPMNIQGWFPLGLTGVISLQSKRLSRVFSSTIVWRPQFFGARPFLLSSFHICIWLLGKP